MVGVGVEAVEVGDGCGSGISSNSVSSSGGCSSRNII